MDSREAGEMYQARVWLTRDGERVAAPERLDPGLSSDSMSAVTAPRVREVLLLHRRWIVGQLAFDLVLLAFYLVVVIT